MTSHTFHLSFDFFRTFYLPLPERKIENAARETAFIISQRFQPRWVMSATSRIPSAKGRGTPTVATTAPVATPTPAAAATPTIIPPFMGVSNRRGCGSKVKDVSAQDFVAAYARHLKASGKLEPPAFAEYCKTGCGREMAPTNPDWYYVRAASVARHIYLRPAGVGALRKVYGGLKSNGTRPPHHALAGGNLLRKILNQLETLRVVERCPAGGRENGGCRRISREGRRELDQIARQVVHENKNLPINA